MHNPSVQTPTILVAEDDVIVRIVIADDLRLAGFEVVEAGSGSDALAVLEADKPIDLILSDIHMPGRLSGIDLATIVLDRFPQTRIILCSGSMDGHELAGISGIPFIEKPYRPEAVIGLVTLLLQYGERERSRPRLRARR